MSNFIKTHTAIFDANEVRKIIKKTLNILATATWRREQRLRDISRNVEYIKHRPQTMESVKLSLYSHHAMKAYGEVDYGSTLSEHSALDNGEARGGAVG